MQIFYLKMLNSFIKSAKENFKIRKHPDDRN